MKEYKIDLQKLITDLNKALEKLPDMYKINCRKNVYEVLGKNLRLNIKISETWIGYELIVKFPDGKIYALWEDTDNYPIDGEQIFYKVSMDLITEIFDVIRAISDYNIYTGIKNKKRYVLVWLSSKNIFYGEVSGRFIVQKRKFNKNDLINMPFLNRIR